MSFMKAIKFGNYRNSSFFCAYITFFIEREDEIVKFEFQII